MPEGYRIHCTTTIQCNEEDFNVMMLSIAALDLQMKEEPMYGNILLFDLKYMPLSYLLSFTPTLTKKVISVYLVRIQFKHLFIHIYIHAHRYSS